MRYENADLIVVGGGLPGVLASLEAVRRGLSVVLVDRGRPGPSRYAVTGSCLRLVHDEPALVAVARRALEAWFRFEDEAGVRLVKPGETCAVAPSDRVDEMVGPLTEHAIPFERLKRSRWPALKLPEEVHALTTTALQVDVTAAWEAAWALAQKAGVRCFADTEIRFLDLEYDRLTAVGQDTAFRGQAMLCTAAELLKDLPVQHVAQQWESSPDPVDVPHLYFHFKGTPVQLVVADGYRISRRRTEARATVDPAESMRLMEFLGRWLPTAPPAGNPELFTSEQGLLLGRHGFREDLVVWAGWEDEGPQLAPGLAPLAVQVVQGAIADPFPLIRRAESSSPGGRSPSP